MKKNNFYIALVVLMISATAFITRNSNQMQELKFDTETSVVGIYTKSILSQKESNEHYGHYKIVIDNTLEVILHHTYQEGSVRPKAEVAALEGKKVKVIGYISKRIYLSKPSITNQSLYVNTPCFYEIKSIELVD